MKKTLLCIIFFYLTFGPAIAQLENTVWKKNGDEVFAVAAGGFANIYNGSVSSTPTYFNSYVLKADTISFTDLLGVLCGNAVVGTYKAVIINDVLTYSVISDPCILRSFQLNNTTWTKYMLPTGIKNDMNSNDFFLYPNPTTGTVRLELPETVTRLVLFNATGNSVYDEEVNTTNREISFDHLPKGMYKLQILSFGKLIKPKNLVIH